uniref:Inositol-pentakisphosphate 2-kinase n=1 Tax=Culex tarsalis TaxID=7177 RepID=A0A1Q3EZC9_CULTA
MGKINNYSGDEGGEVALERNRWKHWKDPTSREFVEAEAELGRPRLPRMTIITVSDVDDRLIAQDLVVCHREEDGDQEHVTAIDESRLVYRAEGNANIVMAVQGGQYVLRLRKSDVTRTAGKDSQIDLVRFIKYTRVMASLFSEYFVPELKLGRVETYDLDAFNKKLIKFRPVTRLDKEIRVRDGILYPDVAFLPAKLSPYNSGDQQKDSFQSYTDYVQNARPLIFNTYCVEIKPKQGWSFLDGNHAEEEPFPNCDSLALPELGGTSGGKCRFCLFQYLKLQRNTIDNISKYCPLDLFSGKPLRMLRAIKGLIGAPQNNFKLTKNGHIVYDETQEKGMFNRVLKEIFQRDHKNKERRKTIFMNLIKETLLKDYSTNEANSDRTLLTIRKDRKKKDKNLIHDRTCSPINYQLLPKNCALKQIQDVQLLVKSNLTMVQPDKLRKHEYVDELYEKFLEYREDCINDRRRLTHFVEQYLCPEERYQLGATALDCSIMITFRRLADREEESLPAVALRHIVSIEGMKFLTNVTITDLDPKTLQHVQRKYLGQLRESAVAYREFLSKMKR